MTLVSRTESHCELPCATWGLLTGGGGGASCQVPRAGRRPGPGSLSPSVAAAPLCWLAPRALRALSCVCRARSVCPPPSTVPRTFWERGSALCPRAHTRSPTAENPGSSRPAVAGVACGDRGWRLPGHSGSWSCGAAFSWETGKVCADTWTTEVQARRARGSLVPARPPLLRVPAAPSHMQSPSDTFLVPLPFCLWANRIKVCFLLTGLLPIIWRQFCEGALGVGVGVATTPRALGRAQDRWEPAAGGDKREAEGWV